MPWRGVKARYTLCHPPFAAHTPRRAIRFRNAVPFGKMGFAYDLATFREQIFDPPSPHYQVGSRSLAQKSWPMWVLWNGAARTGLFDWFVQPDLG